MKDEGGLSFSILHSPFSICMNAPFMIQRFRATQNTRPEVWAETFKALADNRGAADEVWFSTGIGFPKMDWHRAHSARLAAAAEDLRSVGILPSLEIQAIIGHGDAITRYRDDMSGKTWRGWTGHNGIEAEQCSCPRDPALVEYFKEVGRIYAAWHPASLWFDDDVAIRSRAPGLVWPQASRFPGCWCDRCLADFSARDGRVWSREALAAALSEDRALFDRWIDFCFDSLVELVGAVAGEVHAVSPETVFGYQHGGVYRGRGRQQRFFRRLADVSGRKVRSRPGGGAYFDHDPWTVIEKAYVEAQQMRAIAPAGCIETFCPEIESCPRDFGCKTATGLLVESFAALAQGMDTLSYFIADGELEPPSWYGEALFAPLAHARNFLQTYVADNEGTLPVGLDMPFSSPPTRYFPKTALPLCAGLVHATGAILTESALDELADNEIADYLRGGVLLDGRTAKALCDRGFSASLAGLTAEPFDGTVREYFTDDPLNKGLEGGCHVGGRNGSFRLAFSDSTAKVRVLARILDWEGRSLGDGTCLVERADGSRFAILDLDGYEASALSARRLLQIGRVADSVSGGRLPCMLETPALLIVFPRGKADGSLRSVAVINPGIHPLAAGVTLRLRGVPRDANCVAWRAMTEEYMTFADARVDSLLQLEHDGADGIVQLSELAPWGCGYLLVE